ncbi:hypothetical protein [Parendozoicomonas haliclonae]|uniref:Chromosome partition protein Smc n=1 Tax=Parendozoicomonas haliclonae TaxID=1960125 RepID=A0A1X7AFU8_9GAMM|nr:hypothetical protein [Parendozoicomonas haliclonae]SMA37247.1 Chromosome partition protein Smc [Parendozoicomonas haliclonae]
MDGKRVGGPVGVEGAYQRPVGDGSKKAGKKNRKSGNVGVVDVGKGRLANIPKPVYPKDAQTTLTQRAVSENSSKSSWFQYGGIGLGVAAGVMGAPLIGLGVVCAGAVLKAGYDRYTAGGKDKEVEDASQKLQEYEQQMEAYQQQLEEQSQSQTANVRQSLRAELQHKNQEIAALNDQMKHVGQQLEKEQKAHSQSDQNTNKQIKGYERNLEELSRLLDGANKDKAKLEQRLKKQHRKHVAEQDQSTMKLSQLAGRLKGANDEIRSLKGRLSISSARISHMVALYNHSKSIDKGQKQELTEAHAQLSEALLKLEEKQAALAKVPEGPSDPRAGLDVGGVPGSIFAELGAAMGDTIEPSGCQALISELRNQLAEVNKKYAELAALDTGDVNEFSAEFDGWGDQSYLKSISEQNYEEEGLLRDSDSAYMGSEMGDTFSDDYELTDEVPLEEQTLRPTGDGGLSRKELAAQYQQDISELESDLRDREFKIETMQSQIRHLQEQLSRTGNESEKDLRSINKQLDQAKNEIQSLKGQLDKKQEQITKMKAQEALSGDVVQDEIDVIKEAQVKAERRLSDVSKRLDQLCEDVFNLLPDDQQAAIGKKEDMQDALSALKERIGFANIGEAMIKPLYGSEVSPDQVNLDAVSSKLQEYVEMESDYQKLNAFWNSFVKTLDPSQTDAGSLSPDAMLQTLELVKNNSDQLTKVVDAWVSSGWEKSPEQLVAKLIDAAEIARRAQSDD